MIFTGLWDDRYAVQADVKLNSGTDAAILVGYKDHNNFRRIEIDSGGNIRYKKFFRGKYTTVATSSYTPASSVELNVHHLLDANSDPCLKVWVDGVQKIYGEPAETGTVGLAGDQAKFDNVLVGYDGEDPNASPDGDLDDDADDLILLNESFGSTSVSFSHNNAGNLTKDGDFIYTYDAWNRLVKVEKYANDGHSGEDKITIAEYSYGPTGRRVKKVISNRGDMDATELYYYNGPQMIQQRNGSEAIEREYVYGTQYIDERIVSYGFGVFFYHTDANFNVLALSTWDGTVAERTRYTPYGQLVADKFYMPGDLDDDGDVDLSDFTTFQTIVGSEPGDEDWDRAADMNGDDLISSLDSPGLNFHLNQPDDQFRVPGLPFSELGNPCTFTSRVQDPETRLMYYRARQYSPATQRFVQRDPLQYVDGMNLYAYVAGNPITSRDPTGKSVLGRTEVLRRG